MENTTEEKKSTVQSVTFKKEFTSSRDNKQKFIFIVDFANGDKGEYTSLSKDQKFFMTGAEASYKKITKQNGVHTDVSINPIYPQSGNNNGVNSGGFGGGGNSRKAFEKNYEADFISYVASYVKDLMVAGKLPKKKVGTKYEDMKFEEAFEYIYSVMHKKLKQINEQKNSSTSTEQK